MFYLRQHTGYKIYLQKKYRVRWFERETNHFTKLWSLRIYCVKFPPFLFCSFRCFLYFYFIRYFIHPLFFFYTLSFIVRRTNTLSDYLWAFVWATRRRWLPTGMNRLPSPQRRSRPLLRTQVEVSTSCRKPRCRPRRILNTTIIIINS